MAESPAPSPTRLRDRAATEAAIVDAGERILLRDGFPGLNVQTLAAEARCDRKLVYRYFDGADGVVVRLAARAAAELVRALDAAPPAAGDSLRAFARASLAAWLAALRSSPLSLRLMAWALVERSPLLDRIEAERAALLQAWMRERRPRLRVPPEGDPVAINAVLLAAVQQLALADGAAVGGLPLDDSGWSRVAAALDRLLAVFPD
ncbi:MAG: TetR/AcrR family transcriptional regulator [Brevundimonas sp.]|jgi:AcrR family transcriptional regulator|uniref:TetR/AcrR family transcriptional regulator n=1 Tax=Brevundimonas sp. TaxID=1871086 RepID=UPI00182B1BEE|nr:TetR/AcrR family transcriptional regulator [Brevundimonas sp.]MBA4805863.1 TetR/AcrR family transcriptional regulator [Brevundimonas sp.]